MRKESMATIPKRGWLVALCCIGSVLAMNAPARAQIGLGGVSAIMTVPTARVLQDGYLAAGFGHYPKPYAVFAGPQHDNLAYFLTVGFLPFIEVSLRATRASDYELVSIGDRMASLRLQLVPERHYIPAVTIGLHDVIAIQGKEGWFEALYAVASKEFAVGTDFSLEPTLGYGVDWLEARNHEFNGIFGGLSLGFRKLIFLKAEYDASRYNAGLGFDLFNLLTANMILLDMKTMAFGMNVRIRL